LYNCESATKMATKKKKIIAVALAVLCLTLLGAILGIRSYVKSGKLQALIEARAAESLNASVSMKSLRLSLPWRIDIEGLEVSAPGYEESPLLVCPKLTISAAIWDLMKGHFDTIVLESPKISIVAEEDHISNIPRFPKRESSGGGISIKTIKVIDADIVLDTPAAKADLKGILATLSARHTPAGPEKVLRLNIDAANASIARDDHKPIPLGLKSLHSKFVIRERPPGNEIEAEIHTALSAEIPHLRLPRDLPVTLNFEFDYFPQRDSLENATFSISITPSIHARIYGSIEKLTSGTPVTNLNIAIPALDVDAIDEYIELLQRPNYRGVKLAGTLGINGTMKGLVSDPELSFRANAGQGRFEWKGFTLEEVDIKMPLSFRDGDISMGPGRMSAARALVPIGEDVLEIASMSGQVSGDASSVSAKEFACKVGDATEVSLRGSYEFASGRLRGTARARSSSIGELLAHASPVIEELPEDFSASGRLEFDVDVDAKLGSESDRLSAKYRAALKECEFSRGEIFAVAGVDMNLAGSVKTESPENLWEFDAAGDIGNFEILIDTFYNDFSADRFPITFSGEYALDTRQIQNAAASVDLGPTGTISGKGNMRFASAPDIEVDLESERIDIGKAFDEIIGEFLSEAVPILAEAEIGGIASGDVSLRVQGERLQASGALRLSDGRVALADGDFEMDSVSMDLPFDIGLPQEDRTGAARLADDDYGKIRFGNMRIGPVDIAALELDVALKENAISIKNPSPLAIFGGTVDVGAIEGENMLGPSAEVRTSLTVRDISLEQALKGLGLPEVEGTLNADFDGIALTADSLTTAGTARASAFGGSIDMASLNIVNPLSSVRAIRTDLEFKEIDLFTLTRVLDFGSIRGIMEGTIKGLEISQGQPAAFAADFQTVERRGVRQRINFAAVENITILGTGHGFQAGVSRGLASFFEEFGYSSIGFQCTLKNDNFRMKGKVIRGDTEYFVKGVMLGPQINVINRNPGQTVSFKSMLERINRIKAKEETEFE